MQLERWQKFTRREQLLFLGSELERARVWQAQDPEKFRSALERALEFIDLSLADSQWRENIYQMLYLRQAIAELYLGQGRYTVAELYAAL